MADIDHTIMIRVFGAVRDAPDVAVGSEGLRGRHDPTRVERRFPAASAVA